jgi:hypothetical protein
MLDTHHPPLAWVRPKSGERRILADSFWKDRVRGPPLALRNPEGRGSTVLLQYTGMTMALLCQGKGASEDQFHVSKQPKTLTLTKSFIIEHLRLYAHEDLSTVCSLREFRTYRTRITDQIAWGCRIDYRCHWVDVSQCFTFSCRRCIHCFVAQEETIEVRLATHIRTFIDVDVH